MAVPKRKTSPMKRNQRRANHDKVEAPQLVRAEYNGQEIVVPRRIVASLPYLSERELKRLGVIL